MANNALKITEMTACTSPAVTDRFYIASNTAGNAVPRSLTVNNLFANVSAGNISANNITSNNLTTNNLLITSNSTPANSTANTVSRRLWFDNNFVYAALSNNSIKRIALSGSTWTTANGGGPAYRDIMQADRTYYIRPDGNNSNDGLSANSAWLTIPHAYKWICQNLDINGYTITIQLGDGTYNRGLTGYGDLDSAEDSDYWNFYTPQGGGAILLQGNTANVDAVTIQYNEVQYNCISWFAIGTSTSVRYLTFDCMGISGSNPVWVSDGAYLGLYEVKFVNPNNSIGVWCWNGFVNGGPTYWGSGTWSKGWYAQNNGLGYVWGAQTFLSTPTFGTFIEMLYRSTIRLVNNPTMTGSFTGKRFAANYNCFYYQNNNNWTYLPGTIEGTLSNDSQFDAYRGNINLRSQANTAAQNLLVLETDRSHPANGDSVYASFKLSDSAGNQDEFARITAAANVVTSGSEAGQLTFSVKSGASLSDELTLSANALFPSSNGGLEVGTVSNRFANVFLANAATINFANDFIITHAPGQLTLGNFMLDNESTFGYPKIVVQGVTNKALYITSEAAPGVGTDWSHYGGLDWYGRDSAGASRRTIGADFFVNTADAATYTSGMTWYWLSNTANRFLNYVGDSIYPSPNDSMALGKANNAFSDVFLANAATINFANDFIITHAPGQLTLGPMTIDADDGFGYRNIVVVGNTVAKGSILTFDPPAGSGANNDWLGGIYANMRRSDGTKTNGGTLEWSTIDATAGSMTTLLTVFWWNAGAPVYIQASGGNFYPYTNDSIALGKSGQGFSDLFLANGATINFANDVTLTHSADMLTIDGGGLTVTNGNPTSYFYRIDGSILLSDSNAGLYNGGVVVGVGGTIAFTENLWWSPQDTVLHRDAAGTLALRNGTNAQTLRVYNTYSNSTNYERGVLSWQSDNLVVGTEKAGSGADRALILQAGGTMLFATAGNARWRIDTDGTFKPQDGFDNTSDIGSATNRPRNVYVANSVQVASGGMIDFGGGLCRLIHQPDNDCIEFSGALLAMDSNAIRLKTRSDTNHLIEYNATADGPYYKGYSSHRWDTMQSTNTMEFRDGQLRVYNGAYDGTNYERGYIKWTGNDFKIGTEGAGTGATNRSVYLEAGGKVQLRAGNGWHHEFVIDATSCAEVNIDGLRVRRGSLGYGSGSGGTVTQSTSKSTSVTLNKSSGKITMDAAALAATTTVAFTLTNSVIGEDDVLIVNHTSGGTAGSYQVWPTTVASGSCVIQVRNITGGSLAEAIVLSFVVIKGATS